MTEDAWPGSTDPHVAGYAFGDWGYRYVFFTEDKLAAYREAYDVSKNLAVIEVISILSLVGAVYAGNAEDTPQRRRIRYG